MYNNSLSTARHISFLLMFLFASQCYALEKESHMALNEYISKVPTSRFSLNIFLRDQIGFENGMQQELYGKEAWKWLRDGGSYEDEPDGLFQTVAGSGRSNNHFHNPLLSWDIAGLNDTVSRVRYTGQSSIVWGQNRSQDPGGAWSWHDARAYYYNGLTQIKNTDRSKSFADTFRALGQQMHLVQDASVPLHVRNDIHIIYHYEKWLEDIRTRDSLKFSQFITNPVSFDPAILKGPANAFAPVPISMIIDTDRYQSGASPVVTTESAIGLAEYTNANFFSEDTIFSETIPYPATSSVEIGHYMIQDPRNPKKLVSRPYYVKARDGDAGYRLATVGLLKDYIMTYIPNYRGLERNSLDEGVYEDYALRLLPRAVGYSAGLLDYFFRGTIDISLPQNGVYALIDATKTAFPRITLQAKNTTDNGDEMLDGSIELVIKYKLAQQDPFHSGPVTKSQFAYKVIPELNKKRSIPKAAPVTLVFDLGDDPLPLYATDIYLQVVYKGRLGNEDGAVAVGFKDISEPTPLDIANNMDMICINNGTTSSWYDAGSPLAISQVDKNKDGVAAGTDEWDVYPHDMIDLYVKLALVTDPKDASPADHDLHYTPLLAGNFVRLMYLLSDYKGTAADYKFTYGIYTDRRRTNTYDIWDHQTIVARYDGTAVMNQDDPALCDNGEPCNVPASFYRFREQDMWWGTGIIVLNPGYPEGTQCAY